MTLEFSYYNIIIAKVAKFSWIPQHLIPLPHGLLRLLP